MESMVNSITAGEKRLPYKQEVGGSWPSAPTTPSTTYEPSGSSDSWPMGPSGPDLAHVEQAIGRALRTIIKDAIDGIMRGRIHREMGETLRLLSLDGRARMHARQFVRAAGGAK